MPGYLEGKPIFFKVRADLHASLILDGDKAFVVSCHHVPTGRKVYGQEPDFEAAMAWLDAISLAFLEPESVA